MCTVISIDCKYSFDMYMWGKKISLYLLLYLLPFIQDLMKCPIMHLHSDREETLSGSNGTEVQMTD